MSAPRRWLLNCGLVAGPLFVAVFLIEGATRADYQPLRHPVSSLAIGEYGWMQTINFLVAGVLTLAGAVGLWRTLGTRTGPILIGLWGVGLLGAGTFLTDPVNGYPPGTPNQIAESTTSGILHDLLSIPGFFAFGAAGFVFAVRFARRREYGWAAYSALSGLVLLVAFFLAGAAFGGGAASLIDVGGLCQRISVIAGFGWLTALVLHIKQDNELKGVAR
jgi:uncharacterized protein DUF998